MKKLIPVLLVIIIVIGLLLLLIYRLQVINTAPVVTPLPIPADNFF